MRAVYTGSIGYEFHHVADTTRREWLRDAAESGRYREPLSAAQQRLLLERLTSVEAFERFLHTTYLGAKRFSLEGTDTLVPVLDEIVVGAAASGVREIVIGMAHRGRLNVLAHVLGKPYEVIFEEFGHYGAGAHHASAPDMSADGWTGDVKYHLGMRRKPGAGSGYGVTFNIPVIMPPNPSHLEFVNPVAAGMARAVQDDRDAPGEPTFDAAGALAVMLHGDAAFPGQGVVAETLNLSQLRGFNTAGSVHIIVNNQIGYTTDPMDSRSTLYSSDLAKGFEIPIVHVNADDPEACVSAARLALAYRNTFQADVLIDLIGYRRWGHNEGDDPTFTQPAMYAQVQPRQTVRALWAQTLEQAGVVQAGEADTMLRAQLDTLQELQDAAKSGAGHELALSLLSSGRDERVLDQNEPSAAPQTGVAERALLNFHQHLHSTPDDFTINPKLERQLQRRLSAIEREGGIDWALAESLAFASIIAEGTPVRMSGQDAERGTFAQRHLVLHDPNTGRRHAALQTLPDSASFAVYNSPLSETAVLGFEYGYGTQAPETLVLWEAQFGDFANGAQVIIDQFIAAAAAKWKQDSSIVMLLPHGYEGQGPEHSSARLERFLQLCAGDNLRVANCTTAAQYFHLLRRQALLIDSDPRPLIVMTPKSLLRNPKAGSSLSDLVHGTFQTVIDDSIASQQPEQVQRIVFCSGKVHVDLNASEAAAEGHVALVRIEELHPFPTAELRAVLEQYPADADIVWVQEEPRNMGAWSYMEPRLRELLTDVRGDDTTPRANVRYIGRVERASPAEGSADDHAHEQSRIVAAAFADLAPAPGINPDASTTPAEEIVTANPGMDTD